MKLRGFRWPFILLVLIGISLIEMKCFGANSTPLLTHSDPSNEREFQNVYQTISKAPSILTGAGAPAFAPQKIGDIYVSTTTSKVYISTSATSASSWAIMN